MSSFTLNTDKELTLIYNDTWIIGNDDLDRDIIEKLKLALVQYNIPKNKAIKIIFGTSS